MPICPTLEELRFFVFFFFLVFVVSNQTMVRWEKKHKKGHLFFAQRMKIIR